MTGGTNTDYYREVPGVGRSRRSFMVVSSLTPINLYIIVVICFSHVVASAWPIVKDISSR